MRNALAQVLLGYVVYRVYRALIEDAYTRGYREGLIDAHERLVGLLHDHGEDTDVLLN